MNVQTGHQNQTGMDTHRIEEHQHDPYMRHAKWREPCYCPECEAVFHEGRWQWLPMPECAEAVLCPACLRVRDHVPAAYLTLAGEYFVLHREEIMHLVGRIEREEKRAHPLKRIMSVDEQENNSVILYTDPHLARATGRALQSAYKGELNVETQTGEYLLRVLWQRNK